MACLDLATHWYTEKRDNSVMFLPLLFLSYSLACLGQTVMLPRHFSFYWKLSYAYLGGFSIWVVRVYFFDYISLLFLAETYCKRKLRFYRQSRRVFYLCCHSRGFILHLDLPSRQNTQKRGSALLLLIYYLPRFLIDGWPMRCSCFLLYPSFLIIFWGESNSKADSKGWYRWSR